MSKRADLSRKLPSDAQYLLEYMDTVPSDSSDDDFDGYLSDEQGADIDDSGSSEEDCPEPSNSSEVYQGRQQNRYLTENKEFLRSHPSARAHDWVKAPMSPKEVGALLAIFIAMGVVGLPTQRSYWSSQWPFNNDNISSIMSSRRFELLMQFFHISSPPEQPTTDKLQKIRPVMDRVVSNYMAAYIPTKDLSVDESIISFKGRLSWVQFMPKKTHKWGLKAWVLADASNGYAWNWKLYTGKQGRKEGVGLAHHVVMSLSQPLEGKGYHLYCDNFYTSPQLFADLIKAGFEACGTVRKNRKGLSDTFQSIKLSKGEVYSERILDDSVLCLKWQDKRDVLLLSTLHDESLVDVQRRSRLVNGGIEAIKKPKMVHEYNQHMGGVDQSDQLIIYYGYSHRQVKWWRRVFFHLLDLSIANASILYNITNAKPLTQMDFRIELAKGLLQGHTRRQGRHFTVSQELPLRLTERPFAEKVDTDTPHGGRPRCEVCRARGKKRSQTKYRCKVCKVPLHLEDCFETYHTKLNYGQL
eukprot:Em0001g3594a